MRFLGLTLASLLFAVKGSPIASPPTSTNPAAVYRGLIAQMNLFSDSSCVLVIQKSEYSNAPGNSGCVRQPSLLHSVTLEADSLGFKFWEDPYCLKLASLNQIGENSMGAQCYTIEGGAWAVSW